MLAMAEAGFQHPLDLPNRHARLRHLNRDLVGPLRTANRRYLPSILARSNCTKRSASTVVATSAFGATRSAPVAT